MLAIKGLFGKGRSALYFLVSQLGAVIIFGILYWVIESISPGVHFKGVERRPAGHLFYDFFYYSMVTQSTVGYGDIVPVSNFARGAAMCQMLLVYAGLSLTEGMMF